MSLPSQAELETRLAAFHDALEAAARESEARFLAAFHNPPLGIGMHEIDLEHRIRRINPEELKPFLRTFRRADGAGVPMLLLDRRLVDKKGRVIGLRTAMTVLPATP